MSSLEKVEIPQMSDMSSLERLKSQSDPIESLIYEWAPCIRFDKDESFLPLAAGCTIIRTPQKSPSSKFDLDPGQGTIIEYAIWWDWDIEHLYELEHIWVYLDADGQLEKVEASAHGGKNLMADDTITLPLEDGRITVFSEPGKHANALKADWLINLKEYTIEKCTRTAGSGGVHTGNPFGAEAFGNPSALSHRLAKLYMKRRAFTPTFEFSQYVDLRDIVLVSWETLAAWIPERVKACIQELYQTVPHLAAVCLDSGDTMVDERTEVKDINEVVQQAELIPGAADMVRSLAANGYRLALVADGPRGTFENILGYYNLWKYFEAFAISGDVGEPKPAAIMFETALNAIQIGREDYGRVVMVGNNLERDIKGANALGIISIWISWSDRRSHTPADESEVPDYEIKSPSELIGVLEEIELSLPI